LNFRYRCTFAALGHVDYSGSVRRVCICFIEQWLVEGAEKLMGLHFCPGTADGMTPKSNTSQQPR